VEIAFCSTHRSSVDFPSKSVGRGAAFKIPFVFWLTCQNVNTHKNTNICKGIASSFKSNYFYYRPMFSNPCSHAAPTQSKGVGPSMHIICVCGIYFQNFHPLSPSLDSTFLYSKSILECIWR
jgi:hypothetical protein